MFRLTFSAIITESSSIDVRSVQRVTLAVVPDVIPYVISLYSTVQSNDYVKLHSHYSTLIYF